MKTALIAGYTGLVGGELLDLLLKSDKYEKVIALGRRDIDLEHPKLVQQQVDFDNLQLTEGVNDVFCCLGTTIKQAGSKENFRRVDFQYPVNLAVEAKAKGASVYLLVSANGASKSSAFFYNQVKGEVEEAIEKIGFDKLEIVRPSLLLGNRKESRLAEDIGKTIMQIFGFLFVGPLKNVKGIRASSVAAAMLSFANDGSGGSRVHKSGVLQRFN